jgi:glycogen phosphorylase
VPLRCKIPAVTDTSHDSPRQKLVGESFDTRASVDPEDLARAIVDELFCTRGTLPEHATRNDWYLALAHVVRDRLLDRWVATARTLMKKDVRVVAYLSAEFLLGPHLGNNVLNLNIERQIREATGLIGLDFDQLVEQEEEPGLGNGGLGRLAACFLDSLATLEVPAIGYGIRYEFGIFDQRIVDGWQVEESDKWLAPGNPWEIARSERAYTVGFGGRTEAWRDEAGHSRVRWSPAHVVRGIPFDTPIAGYRVSTVNVLRLWKAEATESFDFSAFNVGDYYRAVEQKCVSENLTKILYPNDEWLEGKRLRLEQQYFFVSCSLQDMISMHLESGGSLAMLDRGFVAQLNDTHPSIAVAELMRLLVDEHTMDWDAAWAVTERTLSYTNHTLLPEALEQWSLPLFSGVLPRHLEIIFEINQRFLDDVRRRYPGDEARVARLSIIGETEAKSVRMAHLASVGCHAINGVAELHTNLLKRTVLRDFYELSPQKFISVTNGVTPRRWVLLANPALAALISEAIGESWVREPEALRRLEAYVNDPMFREKWRAVKLENKRRLAGLAAKRTGVQLDPDSLFDIQVKRIHEYKRQHLNVLHVITLYNRLRRQPSLEVPPRAVIFAGKAAPGYARAKLIIRLINGVAEVINADPAVAGRLAVAFLPDFNVTSAQPIYPAADLSEQTSTAGKEASGTGNMKFAMNGALTIGTLDGANVEIRNAVGADNFFMFGLTSDAVAAAHARGRTPRQRYETNPELREAIDQIRSGCFSRGDPSLFQPLVDALLDHDEYLVLEDYQDYVACQNTVNAAYLDVPRWTTMSILNVARSGYFSSDRAIRQYCEEIWHAVPVHVEL